MQDLTPMMRQYKAIKNQHQDAILLFRLGDFYEMFFEDAKLASKELEITLTGRPTGPGRKIKIPMCGVPYHAVSGYIAKLLNRGYKVAICEQTEDPALARGLTKREVVKIITPGTLTESELISEKQNNFLAAVVIGKNNYGLAFADISTGEFKITEVAGQAGLATVINEIDKINPKECLLETELAGQNENPLIKYLKNKNILISVYEGYEIFDAGQILLSHFKVATLEGFGSARMPEGQAAAAAILIYLKKTQKGEVNQIKNLKTYELREFMYLDNSSRSNLELLQTQRDKSFPGSLIWLLDQTQTTMGARLLRQWLLEPLLNENAINWRLDAVEEIYQNAFLREKLAGILKEIYDLERIASRISGGSANARDLIGLKQSLVKIPILFEALAPVKAKLLKPDQSILPVVKQVADLIDRAIVDDPPIILKEGNLIKKGYHPALDELIQATSDSINWIAAFEAQEKGRTGIKSLKVGYTQVFGYYIEITKNNLEAVPPEYIRKQTLVNAERFITPELKEKESFILTASERRQKLESEIFSQIREKISQAIEPIHELAQFVASCDVFWALAEVARRNHYRRPKILLPGQNQPLKIKNGRHPVLEKTLATGEFIPNDLAIGEPEDFFHIITGPNMAGKSTYMRQTGLLVIMAQIGSFVAADDAEVPIVDRIFTRVGAIDDIFGGQSTFMVEMSEVANILNHASSASLIILDEIGRGTSTYDGMSLAQAVAEYICETTKAKTLFATHYHELTFLSAVYPGIKNYTVMIKEKGEDVVFLYKVAPGKASKSYGIHVAKLAGLPKEVIRRAREILIGFEQVKDREKKFKDSVEELPEPDEGEQLGIF